VDPQVQLITLPNFGARKTLFKRKKQWAKICRACGVIDTSCTIFAPENRAYLGEFEAEFKKDLALESGAQGVMSGDCLSFFA
jgi:hypothetical protein